MYVTVYAFNVCINSCLKNCQELLALRLAWAPWCIYCHELLDICTNLLAPLAAALSLSHGLAGAVPVEEVEDCHGLQCMYCHELRELLTSWRLHCRFRMALREPFQWRSWKTVMSSWNSSMVFPRFCSSIKRYAPIPVPLSGSLRDP